MKEAENNYLFSKFEKQMMKMVKVENSPIKNDLAHSIDYFGFFHLKEDYEGLLEEESTSSYPLMMGFAVYLVMTHFSVCEMNQYRKNVLKMFENLDHSYYCESRAHSMC